MSSYTNYSNAPWYTPNYECAACGNTGEWRYEVFHHEYLCDACVADQCLNEECNDRDHAHPHDEKALCPSCLADAFNNLAIAVADWFDELTPYTQYFTIYQLGAY